MDKLTRTLARQHHEMVVADPIGRRRNPPIPIEERRLWLIKYIKEKLPGTQVYSFHMHDDGQRYLDFAFYPMKHKFFETVVVNGIYRYLEENGYYALLAALQFEKDVDLEQFYFFFRIYWTYPNHFQAKWHPNTHICWATSQERKDIFDTTMIKPGGQGKFVGPDALSNE